MLFFRGGAAVVALRPDACNPRLVVAAPKMLIVRLFDVGHSPRSRFVGECTVKQNKNVRVGPAVWDGENLAQTWTS
jgi:hypothetical protein